MTDARADELREDRPDPDALLAEVSRAGGRLKVFLGAAPGVGKTYAMLEEARQRQREGTDVLVGVVETHGRRETERMLAGLDVLPRQMLTYRGRNFSEMDLDGILARKPELVLVDELAHTNVPGSRHPKRSQDIEELLAAGIDVYTTVNVQHLESLNDVVEQISGVQQRETVADAILERADEIKLIDLAPDDLIKRLREGKVYVPDQAQRAMTRFFSKGNLTALREMSLRVAAERVDRQMTDYMRAHGVTGTWPARERVLVCIGPGGDAERLVRTGKRMADRNRSPWIVLHVRQSTGGAARGVGEVDKALVLAETLGAETETLPPSGDLPAAVLRFARARNVSRIVLGRNPKPFAWWPAPSLADALMEEGPEFEYTVSCRTPAEERTRRKRRRARPTYDREPFASSLGWGALSVGAAIGAALVARRFLPEANIALILLAGVLGASLRGSVAAAVLSSLGAFAAYNFFFTQPYLSLEMYFRSDLVTVVFFLLFSVATGLLAARLRRQMRATEAAGLRTRGLYDFTRKALAATSERDMAETIARHVATELGRPAAVLRQDQGSRLHVVAAEPAMTTLPPGSRAAADWALRNDKRAGWTTETLPDGDWLFLPLSTGEARVGLLAVGRGEARREMGEPERRLVRALSEVAALILHRGEMVSEIAEAQRYSETEKLRTALLSSVSHDLRTPLVSILGAGSTLRDLGEALPPDSRADLTDTIVTEAERLNRFVQNLLDMTRLGYGATAVRAQWLSLEETLGAVRGRLSDVLKGRPVRVRIEEGAALVFADAALLEQALVNLVENAAKYSGDGAPISIEASVRPGEAVIVVTDQGPGIAPEDRERIFNLFTRVEAGDRQPAGTGLGLAIARGFVEAMDGRLAVVDPPTGRGAAFELVLPRPAQEAASGRPVRQEEPA